jgi:hypothetical protein
VFPDDLLFRAHCPSSQGDNSPEGFWAAKASMDSIPSSGKEMLDAIAAHVGRKKIPTPFISTTPSLTWALSKAYQMADRSKTGMAHAMEDIFISIIDPAEIDNPIYNVDYQLYQLSKSPQGCPIGAMWYRGRWEKLVWQHIPKGAIIKRLSLADIEAYHSESEIFAGKILQLHCFRTWLDPQTGKMDSPKALRSKTLLNSTVTKLGNESCLGLSKWIVFLGLTPKTVTNPRVLYCAVYWVVAGWRLELGIEDTIEAFDHWCFYGARNHRGEDEGFYQRAQTAIPDLHDAWVTGALDGMKQHKR